MVSMTDRRTDGGREEVPVLAQLLGRSQSVPHASKWNLRHAGTSADDDHDHHSPHYHGAPRRWKRPGPLLPLMEKGARAK